MQESLTSEFCFRGLLRSYRRRGLETYNWYNPRKILLNNLTNFHTQQPRHSVLSWTTNHDPSGAMILITIISVLLSDTAILRVVKAAPLDFNTHPTTHRPYLHPMFQTLVDAVHWVYFFVGNYAHIIRLYLHPPQHCAKQRYIHNRNHQLRCQKSACLQVQMGFYRASCARICVVFGVRPVV